VSPPKITFLVNSGPDSIEAVRARGLARKLPPERTRFLFRDGSRLSTWFRWDAELKRDRPDLLYVLNTAMPGAALAVWWKRRHGVPFLLDTGDAIHEMARRRPSNPFLPINWLQHQLQALVQSPCHALIVNKQRPRHCCHHCPIQQQPIQILRHL